MDQWLINTKVVTSSLIAQEKHKFRQRFFAEKKITTEKQGYENQCPEANISAIQIEKIFSQGLDYKIKKSISNFFHLKPIVPINTNVTFYSDIPDDPTISVTKKRSSAISMTINFGNQAAVVKFHQALDRVQLEQFKLNKKEREQQVKSFKLGVDKAKIVLTLLNSLSGFDHAMIEDLVKLLHTNSMESQEATTLRDSLLNNTIYTPIPVDLHESINNFYKNYPSL